MYVCECVRVSAKVGVGERDILLCTVELIQTIVMKPILA